MINTFDLRRLRDCFGRFATGVAVVTTRDKDGSPLGLTVNSFSSVSLDPPLVLWSLNKTSLNVESYRSASHFAVNVLAADQIDLSNRFAASMIDKFDTVSFSEGLAGIPLLEGCVARIECRNMAVHDGGDHLIFLGEVERFDANEKPVLLFLDSRYGVAARHPKMSERSAAVSVDRKESRSFNDDFIVPLLRRAFDQVAQPFYAELQAAGIPVAEARALSHLEGAGPTTAENLCVSANLDNAQLSFTLHRLEGDGLIEKWKTGEEIIYGITTKGLARSAEIAARAMRFETETLAGMDAADVDRLKTILRNLIYRTDSNRP